MRNTAGLRKMPSLPTLDEGGGVDMDFSRADLMTPFSLSLAAEKAIENAKHKLDEMDSRLSTARHSIDRFKARRISTRAVSDPERLVSLRGPNGRISTSDSSGNGVAGPRGSKHQRVKSVGSSGTLTREEILYLKTLEMKKLRDDLRSLRSRMNQTRQISEAIQSTPPRPPRPLESEVPDLDTLGRAFDQSTEGRMLKRLSTASLEYPQSPQQRLSRESLLDSPTKTLRRKQSRELIEGPTIEYFGGARHSDRHSTSSSRLDDAPIIASRADNPFSPRPYSSTSIMTPMSIYGSPPKVNHKRLSSLGSNRPRLDTYSSTQSSYKSANESFTTDHTTPPHSTSSSNEEEDEQDRLYKRNGDSFGDVATAQHGGSHGRSTSNGSNTSDARLRTPQRGKGSGSSGIPRPSSRLSTHSTPTSDPNTPSRWSKGPLGASDRSSTVTATDSIRPDSSMSRSTSTDGLRYNSAGVPGDTHGVVIDKGTSTRASTSTSTSGSLAHQHEGDDTEQMRLMQRIEGALHRLSVSSSRTGTSTSTSTSAVRDAGSVRASDAAYGFRFDSPVDSVAENERRRRKLEQALAILEDVDRI